MKRLTLLLIGFAVPAVVAAVAMAVNVPVPPAPTLPPPSGTGFLAGRTNIDDADVASFARAIQQSQGSTAVLQFVRFNDGATTGWHTHPGPAIVLVLSGRLDYIDDRCGTRSYTAGNGFVDAGFGNVHNARAVGTTEIYVLYYLPDDATLIREDSNTPCT